MCYVIFILEKVIACGGRHVCKVAEGIKKVSMAVVRRLPKYYSCLGDLIRGNVERVSSRELSKLLGFTASQIRRI